MTDAEFDAPEDPKPAPMRRPVAARAPRPTIEATANPAPKQEVAPIDPKAKEIADLLEHNPAKVLTDPEALEAVLEHMQLELKNFVPDTSTDKGRRAIASFAFKFAKSKTAIDDAGKELNSKLRAEIDAVDEVRRRIRGKFDELRDLARKPLDDWEAAEKRKDETIAAIEAAIGKKVGVLDTAADVKLMIDSLSALTIDEEEIGTEMAERLGERRLEQVNELVAIHERLRRAEEDAAELVRVREENERLQEIARQNAAAETARQQEEADRVANAAAETERQAAAQRQAVAAAEQAERDRSAKAIEDARREGEQRAKAAEVKATIDTSRAVFGTMTLEPLRELLSKAMALDVRQISIGPEYLSIGDLKSQLVQDIDRRVRELEESAAAAVRQEHRKKINTAARDALVELGVPKEKANAIVLAIKEQKIPHVRIDYTENLQ